MGAPLRIAVDAMGLAPGGGLTYILHQAQELERNAGDLDITYFTTRRCAEALRAVVRADRVVVPLQRNWGLAFRVGYEQFRLPTVVTGYDLVYCPGGFGLFRTRVPQVVVDHNPGHYAGLREFGWSLLTLRAWGERWLARMSAHRVEGLVYLSDAFAREMAKVGFPAPTRVIHSGVAIDLPRGSGDEYPLGCEVCASEGFALAVHRWYPHKRLRWLIDAWAHSVPAGRHLVIVGDAPYRRGRRERAAAADTLGIGSSVHLVERVSREEVAALYQRAWAYLSASILEAFPLTPFEAMSFEVPCVLTDIPAHREVAGFAAVYFAPDDAEGLGLAVDEAIRRRPELAAEGTRRLARVSWERSVAQLVEEFRRVAAGGRVGPRAGAGRGREARLRWAAQRGRVAGPLQTSRRGAI